MLNTSTIVLFGMLVSAANMQGAGSLTYPEASRVEPTIHAAEPAASTGDVSRLAAAFLGNTLDVKATEVLLTARPFPNAGLINTTLQVQDWPGNDCGQKINSALIYADHNPVRLIAGPLCGTVVTPVSLGTNQHLILLPGTYQVASTIVLGNNATIKCDASSDAPNSTRGTCVLHKVEGARVDPIVSMTGENAGLSDVTVDANASNGSSGAGVHIKSLRARLDHVSVFNAGGAGFVLGCEQESSNCAAATKLDHVMSLGNGEDGLFCENTSDVYISNSEFENSGSSGIELNNCPGIRIEQSDLGGSGSKTNAPALLARGTSTGRSSSFGILIGNNLSGNYGNDLEIRGWDAAHSGYAVVNWTVTGNQFGGSQVRPGGSFDSILVVGGGLNTITANQISSPNAPHQVKYPIEFRDVANEHGPGSELADIVSSNVVSGTPGTLPECFKMSASETTVSGLNVCFSTLGLSAIGPYTYYPNSKGPEYMDGSGVLHTLSILDRNNVEYMFGHPSSKLQIFQPDPGTDLLTLDGTSGTVRVSGSLQLGAQSNTCSASIRGSLRYTAGISSIKDKLEICAKDEADRYDWRLVQ